MTERNDLRAALQEALDELIVEDEEYPEYAQRAVDILEAALASAPDEGQQGKPRCIECGEPWPCAGLYRDKKVPHRIGAALVASAPDEGPTFWNQAEQRIEHARPAVPAALDEWLRRAAPWTGPTEWSGEDGYNAAMDEVRAIVMAAKRSSR